MKDMRDERGVILAWLARIVVILGLAGLVLFEAATLAINFFGLDSAADETAVALSTVVTDRDLRTTAPCSSRRPNPTDFCQTAIELAGEADARLVSATVDTDGVVAVRLRRTADTLLVDQIGPLEDLAVATAEGRAGTT